MIAWIFPGQGSQAVGMGGGFAGAPAAHLFASAADVLGWDLYRACVEGPQERLDSTEVTQPAVFTTGVAAARTLEEHDLAPDAVAGHSVGEIAALVAAGALRFEDALRAVATRAEAMRRAGRAHPGGMAAVLGLHSAAVEELCGEARGTVAPANFNGPDQTVISGEVEALAEVASAARSQGARVIRLRVSVAAHSPLMRPVRDELAPVIDAIAWRAPRIPVVSSVDGRIHEDPRELAGLILEGITSPVRWTQCVQTLHALGTELFVETGPGAVLSGLVRRIAPEVRTAQVGDDAGARELADALINVTGGADGSVR